MTTKLERVFAIRHAKKFLLELSNSKKIPRIPSSVREEALRVLKHFPNDIDLLLMVKDDIVSTNFLSNIINSKKNNT